MNLSIVLAYLGACRKAKTFATNFKEDYDAALDANSSPYWLTWLFRVLSDRTQVSTGAVVQVLARYAKESAIKDGQPLKLIDAFDCQARGQVSALRPSLPAMLPADFYYTVVENGLNQAILTESWGAIDFVINALALAHLRASDLSSPFQPDARALVGITRALRIAFGDKLLRVLHEIARELDVRHNQGSLE